MDTRAYPIFTNLYDLFYKYEVNVGYKKVVPPSENIYELLSPVALAYWIMGDGLGNAPSEKRFIFMYR